MKEGIYLCHLAHQLPPRNGLEEKPCLFFRPEPWTAEYHHTVNHQFSDLLSDLSVQYKITVLPRSEEQASYFRAMQNSTIRVQESPLSLQEILEECDIFIGGGGSMSREFSLLGVRTISTYQGHLLAVDRYLIEKGAMIHIKTVNAEAVNKALSQMSEKATLNELLEDGRISYDMLKTSITNEMARTRL